MISYLGLKGTLKLRKTSCFTRLLADEFLLEKLPVNRLKKLKDHVENPSPEAMANRPEKLADLNKSSILQEIVRRMNSKEIITPGMLSYTPTNTLEKLIDFFGDECQNILTLDLRSRNNPDLNAVHTHFPQLIELELSAHHGFIKPTNPLTTVQSLHLSTANGVVSDALDACPNVHQLTCSYTEIDFDNFKNRPQLKEIILDNCTFTQGVWIVGNQVYPIDKEEVCLPNITHFSVKSGLFPPNLNLSSLTRLNLSSMTCDSSPESINSAINLLNFLKKSLLLETVVFEGDLPISSLNFLKSCPALKNLTITKEWYIGVRHPIGDLTPLLECSSIENLTLEGIAIDDFGVFSKLANLKTLYIKKCTNMESAKALEEKGIKVINY